MSPIRRVAACWITALVAASAQPPQQRPFVDYDLRFGYGTMQPSSAAHGPGSNTTDGQMQPMGQVDTWQECESLCTRDDKCVSFDYYNRSASPGWSRWCYKRINYQFPLIKVRNRVCGWKGGPAPGPPTPGPSLGNIGGKFSPRIPTEA